MDISSIPHAQLLEIYRTVKAEIKLRKYKYRDQFRAVLAEFEQRYPADFIKKNHGSAARAQLPQSCLTRAPRNRLAYLPHLLAEDWTHLFPGGDSRKVYYVYAHMDPSDQLITLPKSLGGTTNIPFYIGKGTGQRAYDLNRNQGHAIKLRQLRDAGLGKKEIVRVLANNLTEAQALALESKLIYLFGTIYEPNRSGTLLNLDTSIRPEFNGCLKKAEKLARIAKSEARRVA